MGPVVGIFVVAIYGGYFGAGMGILLLAVMALSLPFEIQELQGLRSVLSLIINMIAALIFVVRGHLIVDAVYMFSLARWWAGGSGHADPASLAQRRANRHHRRRSGHHGPIGHHGVAN